MNKRSPVSLLFVAMASGGLAAQAPHDGATPARATPMPANTVAQRAADAATALPADSWRAPIHTRRADPAGGSYGIWAAGATFKVSFHDHVTFYPYVGPDRRAESLHWVTESIAIGDRQLAGAKTEATEWHGAWRYEYRYPGVTEAYQVGADGVEQTFVVSTRPAADGDLTVVGRLQTTLEVPATSDRHGALVFRDRHQQPLVEYGAATAVDAAGRRTPMATSWDGEMVRLMLPAAFLRDAAYPVTVDPLLSRTSVATWGSSFGLASQPEVARDDEAITANVMVTYVRQFSSTDWDAYARLVDDDFGATNLVYSDITTSWSTPVAAVAFVGGADRWVIGLQRDFSTNSAIRAYLHASGDTGSGTGTTIFLTTPAGSTYRRPAVGGTRGFSTGAQALIVFQADITTTQSNTPNTEVYGVLVDATAATFGAPFLLSTTAVGTRYDREAPHVNQESYGGSDSWICVWQEFDSAIASDDWDILASRVDTTGAIHRTGASFFGLSSSTPKHRVNPRVAGRNGRYMVSFLRSASVTSSFGTEIGTHRFDWDGASSDPVKKELRTMAQDATGNLVQGDIAYDGDTTSHWAAVYQRNSYASGEIHVARMGYTGGVVERLTMFNSGTYGAWSPSIFYDDDNDMFLMVYASNENLLPVWGQRLAHSSSAGNFLYGTGCGGSISATQPWAGHEFFQMYLSAAAASQPATLLVSGGSVGISLGFYGAPGCWLNVDPSAGQLIAVGTMTNTSGTATLPLMLLDDPAILGDLYFQWAYGDPSAPWNLKIRTTAGLRVQVRP